MFVSANFKACILVFILSGWSLKLTDYNFFKCEFLKYYLAHVKCHGFCKLIFADDPYWVFVDSKN